MTTITTITTNDYYYYHHQWLLLLLSPPMTTTTTTTIEPLNHLHLNFLTDNTRGDVRCEPYSTLLRNRWWSKAFIIKDIQHWSRQVWPHVSCEGITKERRVSRIAWLTSQCQRCFLCFKFSWPYSRAVKLTKISIVTFKEYWMLKITYHRELVYLLIRQVEKIEFWIFSFPLKKCYISPRGQVYLWRQWLYTVLFGHTNNISVIYLWSCIARRILFIQHFEEENSGSLTVWHYGTKHDYNHR